MKVKIGKIARRIGAAIIIVIIIALFMPTWTPKISGQDSISELRKVKVNDTSLEVMIRGTDKKNPVLIFVHGGPCCSEIPYITKYQEQLEQNFTIIHYDQRGSGKSYSFGTDYSKVKATTHVEDLIALTKYIEEYLQQEQVVLLGHSYGTYIATMAAAKAAKNAADVTYLKGVKDAIAKGEQITPRDYVRKYGFAAREIDENKDYLNGFLFGTEYNLLDMCRFYMASGKYQDALIMEALTTPISDVVTELNLPVYFVMGQYDGMTSPKAAKEYLDKLTGSGERNLVVFEESAHYPQLEEKEKFYQWMCENFS